MPSVVAISSVSKQMSPIIDDIFENNAKVSRGTGFFVKEDIVVTSYHVVREGHEIFLSVKGNPGRYRVTLIGFDPLADIAVLRVKGLSGKPVKWSSNIPEVGEEVFSIGHPYGLTFTVTRGIVSYTDRRDTNRPFVKYIQTDASINSGNSGGPLFNMYGEVVGIIQSIISASGGSNGIGLSTSSAVSQITIARILKKGGKLERTYAGVTLENDTRGLMVVEVGPGSPAGFANVRVNDLILKVDGVPMVSFFEFIDHIQSLDPGDIVWLEIERRGTKLHIPLKLGRLPE